MAAVTVVTEEGSEVEGDEILVAVVKGFVAAVVAIATTEEDTNAASTKLLITEAPMFGLIMVTIIHLG